jgi:hypothetical protein
MSIHGDRFTSPLQPITVGMRGKLHDFPKPLIIETSADTRPWERKDWAEDLGIDLTLCSS